MVIHEGSAHTTVLALVEQLRSRGWSGLARILARKRALIGTSPLPPTAMSAFFFGFVLALGVGFVLGRRDRFLP